MSTSHFPVLDRVGFVREVLLAKRSALIGFSAGWCTPCRSMGATFLNLSRAAHPFVLFGVIDIDDEPELAEQLLVGSVPTLLFFDSGIEVKRILRTPKEAELEIMIEKLFSSNNS